MKRISALIAIVIMFIAWNVQAQNEGSAVAMSRFERDKGIYLMGGYSLIFGDNIGDYSNGVNLETGYNKRINRLISLGAGISYQGFKYDASVSNSLSGGSGNNVFFNTAGDEARIVEIEGGDLSLISLAFNLKLSLIPVSDRTKFSVYGFAKPFITVVSRKAVSGVGKYAYYDYNDDYWYYDPQYDDYWDSNTSGLEALDKETKMSGGIFVGLGFEILPSGPVSVFSQLSFGYTLPITYVSTASYPATIQDGYLDKDFPMHKGGFPSLNIQVGISYNFK